jgi:hypothetical protein
MKILHRFGLRATADQRRALELLGVSLPPGLALPGGGDALVAFDVAEDHPNWSQVQSLLREWDAAETYVHTRFNKREIAGARWLELLPDRHQGYPQPEDGFAYRAATYDLANWCEQCGIGLVQVAPFRMKREPSWGRTALLQLNWVFDEYFATPEAWSSVFEPAGVACRAVLNTRGAELESVVQLVIDEKVDIETEGLPTERCPRCGRTRYLPVTRGPFPALRGQPASPIVRTAEYFGSGALASNRVLVAQDLARSLSSAGIRGASLRPVAPT